MENKNGFEYTYSAPTEEQKREIERIRQQYSCEMGSSDDKMVLLRRLDKRVNNTATAIAIILGVIGTLIFGLGMSMVLEFEMVLWGCIIGVIGIVPVALAYPVYAFLLARGKKKYGAKILALTEEILGSDSIGN